MIVVVIIFGHDFHNFFLQNKHSRFFILLKALNSEKLTLIWPFGFFIGLEFIKF